MNTRISSILGVVVLSGLMPVAAYAQAEGCGVYDLSDAQQDFIDTQDVVVPEGTVPQIERCDVNADNVVDIHDIRAISRNRNQPSAHPDDPMDWNKDHFITISDARGCQRLCALPRCRTPMEAPAADEEQIGGTSESASCSQTADLDGDGNEDDFAGVYEHTGEETRGNGWTLEVVIMTEDDSGNVEAISYPYTGQSSDLTGGEVSNHLSAQPPGEVDLNPGTLMLDESAIVAYRNGEPHVVYYIVDGVVNRAFFGIDD